MARVMTLDGLNETNLREIRARLDGVGQSELSWWSRPMGLGGILDPIKLYPLWLIAGLLGGAWLAGSARGRRLLSRRR